MKRTLLLPLLLLPFLLPLPAAGQGNCGSYKTFGSAEILTAPYERTRHKSTSSCAGQSGRSARDGRLEEGCFNVERPKAFDGALDG